MPRVKRGTTAHRRHGRLLERAKGFRGRRRSVYRVAKQAVMRSEQYAYRDRRRRKRDFRSLWIVRINAAARRQGMTYSQLMGGLKRAGVSLDRKRLSDLAVVNESAFAAIAALAKG
jgi:large subunit ribosomal protein L20